MNNPHFRMPKVQVLVADASRARFFTVDSPKAALQEIRTEVHPEGRLHPREMATGSVELTTDKAGRQKDDTPYSRSSMEDRTEPKETERRRFARELAGQLESDRNKGELERLYLVAPPKFLGELRRELTDEVRSLIAEEIDKDMTLKDARSLRSQLPELLK